MNSHTSASPAANPATSVSVGVRMMSERFPLRILEAVEVPADVRRREQRVRDRQQRLAHRRLTRLPAEPRGPAGRIEPVLVEVPEDPVARMADEHERLVAGGLAHRAQRTDDLVRGLPRPVDCLPAASGLGQEVLRQGERQEVTELDGGGLVATAVWTRGLEAEGFDGRRIVDEVVVVGRREELDPLRDHGPDPIGEPHAGVVGRFGVDVEIGADPPASPRSGRPGARARHRSLRRL